VKSFEYHREALVSPGDKKQGSAGGKRNTLPDQDALDA
jgi:hypothetical protein